MFFITMFRKGTKSQHKKTKPLYLWALVAGVAAVLVLSLWAVYRVNYVPSQAYCEGHGEYSLIASTYYEREQFFAQFGFEAESLEHSTVRIPSGGEVFEGYNSLQKSQGLDLRPFMGKQAHCYVLSLHNKTEEELFGVLTVYKDRVVAFHLTDLIPGRELRGMAG